MSISSKARYSVARDGAGTSKAEIEVDSAGVARVDVVRRGAALRRHPRVYASVVRRDRTVLRGGTRDGRRAVAHVRDEPAQRGIFALRGRHSLPIEARARRAPDRGPGLPRVQ